MPSISDLKNSTREAPLNWSPVLRRIENQSEDSCNEQCQALIVMTNRAMMKKSGLNTKNVCLAGPPGSGKTFLTHVAALFAISQGLSVMTTAIAAEQALLSGGMHIHSLFHVQVGQKMHCHPMIEATNCTRNLIKHEISCILLSQIDVFMFQELGLVSSEIYSIIDNAMKHLIDNDLSMGGKLVLADGDPCQLSPVSGSLI